MQEYHIRFGQTVMNVPWWWFDAMLAWLGVMGLILFFFGKRLVRPAFALAGLLAGGLFMLLIAGTIIQQQWPNSHPMPFIIIGALIGALSAFILWRLGLGFVMAATVAVVAPTVFVIARGLEPPQLHEPVTQAWTDLGKSLTDTAGPGVDMQSLPAVFEPIFQAKDRAVEVLRAWWSSQATDTQWVAALLCLGGAAAAMFIGFAFPGVCSMLVTSLFGVLLMVGGAYRLAGAMGEGTARLLPTSPRYIMLAVLLATLLGVVIQWMLTRKKAAKKT